MGEAISTVYGKYADFSGRAPRSEYWWYTLFFVLVYGGLFVLAGVLDMSALTLVAMAFALGSLLPTIAVSIRRLHDTGRSGWWYLLNFVPFGSIVILVFMCLESEPANQYGPNPHEGGV